MISNRDSLGVLHVTPKPATWSFVFGVCFLFLLGGRREGGGGRLPVWGGGEVSWDVGFFFSHPSRKRLRGKVRLGLGFRLSKIRDSYVGA